MTLAEIKAKYTGVDKWREAVRQDKSLGLGAGTYYKWRESQIMTEVDQLLAQRDEALAVLKEIRKRIVPSDVVAYLMELQDLAANAVIKAEGGK